VYNHSYVLRNYFRQLCRAAHKLLIQGFRTDDDLEWFLFLFEKMILNGFFPSSRFQLGSVSYFEVNRPSQSPVHAKATWNEILQKSTWSSQQAIINSLLASISIPEDAYDSSDDSNILLVEGGCHLASVLEACVSNENMLIDHLGRSLAKFSWDVFLGRVVITWLSHARDSRASNVLDGLFEELLAIWTTKEHIEHSLISQHQGK
jgi:telomere length regulation protein